MRFSEWRDGEFHEEGLMLFAFDDLPVGWCESGRNTKTADSGYCGARHKPARAAHAKNAASVIVFIFACSPGSHPLP